MIGTDSGTGIAVEILMEEDEVFPVGIGLEGAQFSGDGPVPGRVPKKDSIEAPRDFSRDFRQTHLLSAAGREFHLEVLSEVVMEFLQ